MYTHVQCVCTLFSVTCSFFTHSLLAKRFIYQFVIFAAMRTANRAPLYCGFCLIPWYCVSVEKHML